MTTIEMTTPPCLYRHYKGAIYRVLFTALESTNGRDRKPVVVYLSLEHGTINVRDENEFHQLVKVEDGTVWTDDKMGRGFPQTWPPGIKPRFELMETKDGLRHFPRRV